jgi:hypothetical protein
VEENVNRNYIRLMVIAGIILIAAIIGMIAIRDKKINTDVTAKTTKVGLVLTGGKDDASFCQANYEALVNISDDLIFPDGAYDILKGLLKLMRDHISNGQLIDAYQGDLTDDKQIHVARQITNTAEEIEFLLHGHWHNGQYYIEIDDDELKTGFNDESDNGPYHLKQTVNEPYKDYDCGFYRVYENNDRHLYLLLEDVAAQLLPCGLKLEITSLLWNTRMTAPV